MLKNDGLKNESEVSERSVIPNQGLRKIRPIAERITGLNSGLIFYFE
jgi:hypothetical protein